MALTIVILICFLAGIAAEPHILDLPNLRCSEECHITSSLKLSYEIGKTYRYKYSGSSKVNIIGLEQGRTSSKFTANVDLIWMNPCDVLMHVKDVKVDGVDSHIMEPYPTVVSFINGKLDKICIHPKDAAESVNMKRGIASYMQNSLPELTSSPLTQIFNEEDVIGNCPTSYTVEAKGKTAVVTKERNHNKCENSPMQVLDIPWMKTHLKLYDSKSQCKQEITNGIFINIWCKDSNTVNPIPGSQDIISATAEASLRFDLKNSDTNNLQSLADITLIRSHLTYDYRVFKKSKLVSDIDNTFSTMCVLIQSQGLPEVTASVARAIVLLRHAPNQVMVETLQKIRRREYCSNFQKLESIFLDVVPYIGKAGAISIMAKELAANRVSGGRLPIYVTSLYLLNNPSEDIIKALTPILLMNDPEPTIILSTASVINKYCNQKPNCMETELMKNIMNIVSNKLKTQCTLEFSTEHPKEILGRLKALGNIGRMTPEVAANVLKCVQLKELESNIRFTAAKVLRGAPCSKSVKKALFDLVFDPSTSTEIRIASYLATISCISEEDIDHILTKITHIVNTDVYSFITSHLLNFQKTNWPTKRHLHNLLSSKNIPFLHQGSIIKQSQNLQMSYAIPFTGSGIELESNIIQNEKSYFPKVMNLDFNMNFMGSVVNIGEIGTIIGNSGVSSEDNQHESYLSTLNFNTYIEELIDYIKNDGESALRKLKTQSNNRLLSSIFKHLSSRKIQLPKTELYAKIFDQELFFFSLFGDRKEFKTAELFQTLTLSIQDILDGIKGIDIDTARAGQIHLHHIIPTIQGLPLTVSAEATALANINLKSNYSAKDGKFQGNMKFAPSFSLQVDGYIGYGQNIKNGIKMKTVIYTTNGLSIDIRMRDGQAFDINFNLPDKMELLNIKSEVYPVKSTQKGNQVKVLTTDLHAVQFTRDQCLGIIESFTGLHICYKINIPSIISQNGISLAKPVLLKLFLQKSIESMKGYQVSARFKNTDSEKTLKINFGIAGVSIPREFNLKLSHTVNNVGVKIGTEPHANQQDNDISVLNLDFHSSFLRFLLEVTAVDKEDQSFLLFFGDVKYETSMGEKSVSGALRTELKQNYLRGEQQYKVTLYTARSKTLENERLICYVETLYGTRGETTKAKFSTHIAPLAMSLNSKAEFKTQSMPGFWIPKVITIGNFDISASLGSVKIENQVIMASNAQYQSSLTLFYHNNIILALSGAHQISGNLGNFIFDTKVGVRIGTSEWSSTTYFTYDHAKHTEALIKLVRADNSRVFYIKIKYDLNDNTHTTNTEVYVPGIMEPIKTSVSLENLDSYNPYSSLQPFHSFNITSKVIHGNSVYLQVEGPIVLELSSETIIHHFDLKISGSAAFHGTHHFIHNLILSPYRVQFLINLKKEQDTLFNFNSDMSRGDFVNSFQFDIYLPYYVKSVIEARVNSMSAEAFMDTVILPNIGSDTDIAPNIVHQSLQNTVSRRRVKGNAKLNIETQELKGELYWDVENDKEKKMSVFSAYNYDDIDHHITINGDLLLFSETYNYKISSVLGSPFNWFSGNNGIELFITLPTNAVFTWKAKCKVMIEDSTIALKPLLFVQLMNNHKYVLTGSLELKNIQTAHNLAINSEWNLSLPDIQNVKLTNKYIQQIEKDSYKAIFKTHLGESAFNDAIEFDIISDSKSGKYSNMVKLKIGDAHPTEIVAIIAGSSQATDVSFTVMPFGSTNSLTVKLAKTSQSTNLAILKNKKICTMLQFIMASPTSYVFILKLPTRTIEVQSMAFDGKINIDIYPEKNISDRKSEVKIAPNIISRVGHLDIYIGSTSMQKPIEISAKCNISNTMENVIDFDMNYPIKDIKNLTSIIIKELEIIHQEIKNEGMFIELNLIFNNLKYTIKKIPSNLKPYIHKLRISSMKIYKKIQEAISNLYKIYKTDVSLLWKQFISDINSYWNTAEENIILFAKPVINFIMNSDFLQRISESKDLLAKQYPVAYDIINDFFDKVIITYLNDIANLFTKMNSPNNDVQQVIKELKTEFYLILQHFHKQLLDTKIVAMIQTKIDFLIEQHPLLYKTAMNFFSKNKEILEENINLAYERITNSTALENFQISSVYKQIIRNIKDNISWKSIIDALRNFIKENLGIVYSISNEHITASLHLPMSVSTVYSTLEFFIYRVPVLLVDITTNIHTSIKENILPYMGYIQEEAPQFLRNIVNYLKAVTNITISISNHLLKILMDTEIFKTLQSKIQELIENYPSEIIEEFINWAIASVKEYTMWLISDIEDIPYVRTALKYIRNNLIAPLNQFICSLLHTHKRVKVQLYYESMCPFCKQFIVEQLYPTWKELSNIMKIEMFPYGNAKYEPSGSGWNFTCQHGPEECKGNMIEACAIDKLRNINIEMDFINCLEASAQPAEAGANCSANVGVAWGPIEACVNSLEGQILLHNIALRQEKLQPKLKYVPWILINDHWSEKLEDACTSNLKKVVCDFYGGKSPKCDEIQPTQMQSSRGRTYP